ncbi:MAG: flagellar protein FlbB [Treponema sp.]|jgi:flagellar protein FlbB|nr:flagellar protein FlbB [Treponema sp.]
MAGGARIFGRVIVLLLLILIMAGGSLLWFDYLGIIDAKSVLSPLYRFIGREGRTQAEVSPDETLNLDAERLAIRLEALDLQERELDGREQELENRYGELEQIAQMLAEQQKAQDDRENSFNAVAEQADIRERNIETNARLLTGMPPEQAVGIMAAMDDLDVINVFRKTEEIAQAEGTQSIVSYWLSLMEPGRAAELQRKMAGMPPGLN